MKKLYFLIALTLLTGCATVREIPVETIEKVVIRDSLITVVDTVRIKVPVEVEKEVLPQLDTSHLETTLAYSEAWLDTTRRMIHHSLQNKPQEIKKPVEVETKIVTIEKEVEKEVPVKVPQPYTPGWVWILVIFNVGYFGIKIGRHFLS